MPLVDIQVETFAGAFVAPVLAPTIAAPALGAGAAIIILIAVLTDLLAGGRRPVSGMARERHAGGGGQEGFERAAT